MAELSAADAAGLRAAFAVAARARTGGNLPFGCVVADESGDVVCEQGNRALRPVRDPTAHAEALAAGEVSRRFEPERLAGFTLYTNAEPCAMCAGAIYWAGLGRVVYGLAEADLLAMTGDHPDNPTMALACREVLSRGQRRIEVVGPALEEEARAAFEGYFG